MTCLRCINMTCKQYQDNPFYKGCGCPPSCSTIDFVVATARRRHQGGNFAFEPGFEDKILKFDDKGEYVPYTVEEATQFYDDLGDFLANTPGDESSKEFNKKLANYLEKQHTPFLKIESLQDAIAIEDNPLVKAELYNQIGETLRATQFHELAIDQYANVTKILPPENTASAALLSNVILNQARSFEALGRKPDAETYFAIARHLLIAVGKSSTKTRAR